MWTPRRGVRRSSLAPCWRRSGCVDWTRDPLWLSTSEAAERLGVTARTVYSFINDGSLPAYRMGRKIQVLAADVEAFIEAARIQPGMLPSGSS